MVDPAWNLIIIDNSRAFTTDTDERVHKLTRIDRDLWDRIVALDEPTLQAAVGEWLGDKEIRAILERRDEMAEDIEKLVERVGERAAFVRWRVPPPVAPVPALTPEPAPKGRAESAELAELDLNVLGGQLVDALHETPIMLPGSELTWFGRVVRLNDYEGPDAQIAEAGADRGHTHGLVSDVDGLLCLRRDDQNPEHYMTVTGLAGQRAEVFGLVTEDDGLSVVQVTLCRKAP